MKNILWIISIVTLLSVNTGCVRRVVTIDSTPTGAEVYFGRKFVGKTPYDHEFLYYGTHYIELVKEGYENYRSTIKLRAPFYQFFPFYIFSELLFPWKITDDHYLSVELEEGLSKKAVITPIAKPQPDLPEVQLEKIKFN